ncbi:MAG: FecR domain-containing protein [Bacteroidales bacterium]|nr:FecR domain-containing protein [Bacteroidales bacterium]
MIFIEEKYRSLIINYLSGDCNPEETQHLLNWIQSSDAHFRFFIEVKQLWEAADDESEQDLEKVNQAWLDLDKKLELSKPKTRAKVFRLPNALTIAFRVAAVVVLGFFSWKYFVPEKPASVLYADTLSDQKEMKLADGTIVQLNYESNFAFPEEFAETDRLVKLSGEAFFQVTPNPEKPFIIDAGEVFIQVLGTSFNVNSRPDLDEINVLVEEGTVKVYQVGTESNQVILSKGDQVSFNKLTNVFDLNKAVDLNQMSWKSGDLIFRNSSLDDVFDALERHYNVKFYSEEKEILELPLTTKFSDNTLEESLSVISTIFQLEFEQEDSLIIVKSKF